MCRSDVVMKENLCGDIRCSDLGCGRVGGLGVTPSANFRGGAAMLEAGRSSGNDIGGNSLPHTTTLLLSGPLMLYHRALDAGGTACTTWLTETIVRHLEV